MAITERLSKTTEQSSWRGEIPLEFVYTMGRAGEKFFRAIKDEGKFLGARCDRCDIVYVPPRIYCEQCLSRLEDSYVEVNTRGFVHTYTFCYEDMEGNRFSEPKMVALVYLENADGGLVHFLGEVDPKEVYIGMEVEAVFKPKEERQGNIHDILYFRPVD